MLVLPILFAVLPSFTSEPVLEDHTGLIPADVTVLVRFESLDAAYASVVRMSDVFGADEVPAKEDFFGEMFQLPIETTHIDSTRPIYLAADVTLGAPMPTFLLPASDVAGLSAAVTEAGMTAVARGNWVGFSMMPGYEPAGTNPRLAALQPGVITMNVDLEKLLEVFGGLIEMALMQAEAGMAELPSPEEAGGMDMEAMVELYLDGFRTFLDCAESFDFTLYDDGQQLAFNGIYTALEGSELADMLSPRPLPKMLPAPLDPDAQIAFLMAADWSEVMTRFGPLMEDLMEFYPDGMSTGFGAYMSALTEAYALMGDAAVGSGGFGPQGMNFAFYAEVQDPAAFTQKLMDALTGSSEALAQMGMTFEEPRAVELNGISAKQWAMNLDYNKLGAFSGAGLDAAQSAELEKMMSALYGENPVFTVANKGQRVCMSMGSDEADLTRALAGIEGKSIPAGPVLASLFGLPESMHPLVMYRMDIAQLLNAMGPLMEASGGMPELPDAPMKTTFWMGIDGRKWFGSLSASSVELKNFVQAVQGQ